MANSSIILSNLDFDTLKNTFKSYMKSQDRFRDYDFEGSNMAMLIDLLAYNSFHNAFYLNMVGNEMFMDSAQMRDSVISHAKELNYTPQSFKSAEANVTITITSTNLNNRTLVMPKGTSFTSILLNKNYTFSTAENIVFTDYTLNNDTIVFTGSNISLYEGFYLTDTYTYAYDSPRRFYITNKNVDISSVSITVLEDGGDTALTYQRATSLFDINSSSKVFFVQAAENSSYEIIFGDGISGRRPKNNSVIVIEYRTSSGELPNGCNTFKPDTTIQGESNITVTVNEVAGGGSVYESVDSIKFNAPRHFTTQERAITTEDYETLLKLNYPEINTVVAYGGEDLDPPQYGRVFVSVDLKDVDALPDIKRQEYYNFLKPRSPVSIDPVFVDPEYTYIGVTSNIKYNVNVSSLGASDIKTIVTSSIIQYALSNLNNFNKTFYYSRLVQSIDGSQAAIVSNETDITLIKVINPTLGSYLTFDVDYKIPLDVQSQTSLLGEYCITSTFITYKSVKAYIRDDGNGKLVAVSASTQAVIDTVGTVNYTNGKLQFSNFYIEGYTGAGIKIYAIPKNKDITTFGNVILNILEEDLVLNATPVRV